MTPETFTSLVNLGSAGAVIAVVIIFLRSIKERDAEWRNFFTELNKSNKADVCELAETMQSLVDSVHKLATDLALHDQKVDQRIDAARETATKPVRKTASR